MSIARNLLRGVVLFFLGASATSPATGQTTPRPAQSADPAAIFQRGQDALNRGELDAAERDFRQVLKIDPRSGAACANLGVVAMRHKQWGEALDWLQRAQRLLPQVAGIRLNIGLAYYRQNEFPKAIAPFESVVRDQPDALQPRYLLGLCYFFVDRWADAASTLEPLWPQQSAQLPYLYVLSNAAHRAGRTELDNRATEQLIRVGGGSPEYHLFIGKYHLNQMHYDQALAEFQQAAQANPKLPFVHFDLGLTYLKKQEFELARDEFLQDAAIEPDLALDYDRLGDVYWTLQDDKNAEKNYREALRHDARLVSSRLGLAKIYQRQKKFQQALVEVEAAAKLDPDRTDTHYIHGQLLLRLGRKTDAKKELDEALRLDKSRNEQARTNSENVPSPELMQDPQ